MRINRKLIIYLGLFLGLTLLGILWSVTQYDLDAEILLGFQQLKTSAFLVLGLLYLLLYVTDIWRYQVLARALGQHISFMTGLEVSVANDFFSWITPGAAMGAPAAIYVLGKKGMNWEFASIVCFGKSMIGSAILLIGALLLLFFGLAPPMSNELVALLLWGFTIVVLILVLPILAAIWLDRSIRTISTLELKLERNSGIPYQLKNIIKRLISIFKDSIQRLGKLESNWRWLFAVTLVHIPYLLVFSAMLTFILWEFTGNFAVSGFYGAVEYIAFTYVAPTPGAAGLSEATAASFFAQLVTPAQALLAVLLFRAMTVYMHLLVGFIYVSIKSGIIIVLRDSR